MRIAYPLLDLPSVPTNRFKRTLIVIGDLLFRVALLYPHRAGKAGKTGIGAWGVGAKSLTHTGIKLDTTVS